MRQVAVQAVMSLNYQSAQTEAAAPSSRRRRMVFFEEHIEQHHVTERQSDGVPPAAVAPIVTVGVAPYAGAADPGDGGTSTGSLAPSSADSAKAPALVVLAMALVSIILV